MRFLITFVTCCVAGSLAHAAELPEYREHQNLAYYLDETGQRQAVETPDDWQIRRGHILQHMQRVMGRLPDAASRVPLEVKLLEESSEEEIIRRKISFQSDASDRVNAWLLSPAATSTKNLPAVLCLHQTIQSGKDEPVGLSGSANMHYAIELARRGYVTLSPDYPSLGEHTYDFAAHPEYLSGTMKAIWDNIRAVDLLESRAEVDGQRIGVIGHSLGAHNAMFTAAFEPRLQVIVSSCGFTTFRKDDLPSWTGPRYMPRIATEFANDADRVPFDFTEIVASFAPRPFLAVAATRDSDFDVSGVRDVIDAAAPIYRLFNEPENLHSFYPDSPHDFPAAARQKAYEFLDRHLKQ